MSYPQSYPDQGYPGPGGGYPTGTPRVGMTTRPWDYPWLAKATSRIGWAFLWGFLACTTFLVWVLAASQAIKSSEISFAIFTGLITNITAILFAVQYFTNSGGLQDKISNTAVNAFKSERNTTIALVIFLAVFEIFWFALMGSYSPITSACSFFGGAECAKAQATLAFSVLSFFPWTWALLMAVLDLF